MTQNLDDFLKHYGSFTVDDSDSSLTHYSSKYYNPAKAREYYLRTRRLKGRRPAQAQLVNPKRKTAAKAPPTTAKQRAALSKAKTAAKRAELEKAKKANEQRIAAAQAKSKASRAKVASKLKELRVKVLERFMKNMTRIPKGASPERAAQLAKAHRADVQRATNRANGELSRIAEHMRGTVKQSRATYDKQRDSINKKYAS